MNNPIPRQESNNLFSRQAMSVLAVISLLLMTVGLFEFAPRYEAIGPEMLRNGGFKDGFDGWTTHGAKGTVAAASGMAVLESGDASKSVGIRQIHPAPPGLETLLLSVEASTEGVLQGAKSWYGARIYVVGRNAEGKSLWQTHRLATHLFGDNSWRYYSTAFPVTEDVKEIVVGAQLIRTTGAMRLRGLSLLPARERTGFRAATYVLLAAWAVTLAWIGGSLVRDIGSTVMRGLIVFVTLGISAGVLISGQAKQKLLATAWGEYERFRQALAIKLPKLSGIEWGGPEYLHVNTSQIGHLSLFFTLAVLVQFAWRTGRRAFQLLTLLLFAAVTESLQYFVSGREATVEDWSFDAGGILAAFALLSFFALRKNVTAINTKGRKK